MCDTFFLQQAPDARVVDSSQTVMCTSNGSDRPRKGPSHAMEHRESPEVASAGVGGGGGRGRMIERGLNYVGHASQVGATMSVDHTLGAASRAGSIGEGECGFFGKALRGELGPVSGGRRGREG